MCFFHSVIDGGLALHFSYWFSVRCMSTLLLSFDVAQLPKGSLQSTVRFSQYHCQCLG